jgi:hypothetical protein
MRDNQETITDTKITTNMVKGIYENILLNLNYLSKKYIGFSEDEIENIKKEFKKVFENTKINGDTEGNKTKPLHIKDTLELFDNINIFLNSALKGKENKLRNLLVEEFTNKDSKRDIKTLISVFNKASTFDKHIGQIKNSDTKEYEEDEDNLLKTSTSGPGEPDTAILNYIDDKWVIDFSAASNTGKSDFEGLQLYIHTTKLQMAYNQSISFLTGIPLKKIKDISLEELKDIQLEELSNQIKLEYKKITDKYDFNSEKPTKFFEHILEEDISIDNVLINGTYSDPSLLFLKDNDKGKKPQNRIVEDLNNLKDENVLKYNKQEINELSQWMAIGAQLSNILPKIEEVNLNKKQKKELAKIFLKKIETMLDNMTYTEVTDTGVTQSEFNKNISNEERIEKLIQYLMEYSNKEYDGKIQNIFNSNLVINNFLSLMSFIKMSYPILLNGKEEQITEILETNTLHLINISLKEDYNNLSENHKEQEEQIKEQKEYINELLITLKNIDKRAFFDLLKLKQENIVIKQYIEDNHKEILELSRQNGLFEEFINELLADSKEGKLEKEIDKKTLKEDRIKNIINSFPNNDDKPEIQEKKKENFTKSLLVEFDKSELHHLDFLEIMEEVGEIPISVGEDVKADVENIIKIFNNFTLIFSIEDRIEIEREDVKELFNSLLSKSFKLGVLNYKKFIEILALGIKELYQDKKVSDTSLRSAITSLKSNLTLKSFENDKMSLSKKIIKRASEIKEVKKTSSTTEKIKPKGDKK